MIHLSQLLAWVERIDQKVQEQKEYLTELDQKIGDGDHGINLSRGFSEVRKKLAAQSYTEIGALFQDIGMTLLTKVGGASGPLYGTIFLKMAAAVKGKSSLSIEEWAHAMQEAVLGVKARGKAEVGQKTLLDVWEPLSAYIREQGERVSWSDFLEHVNLLAEESKHLEAKKGRAAYLGARSIGHLDAGTASSYLMFEALVETMQGDGGSR